MNIYNNVIEASGRIKPFIRETPLEYSRYLSDNCGCKVFLKLENQQVTGSFKARGAVNMVHSMTSADKDKGVITASTGNHAAAVGYALDIADTTGDIYMPNTVSELKIKNLEQYERVKVILFGEDSVESEREAILQAKEQEKVYISPYNDKDIIAGQGTIGFEILMALPDTDAILVPVGGGGLISGIAGYSKVKKPSIEIIGCQPVNSAVMYHSHKAGKVVNIESLQTISDGTAGGIEEETITFPICQEYVQDYHLVEESEIINALGVLLEHHQIMAEGAAGLSVASLIKNKELYKGKTVVLIMCGNKMSLELLKEVIKYL